MIFRAVGAILNAAYAVHSAALRAPLVRRIEGAVLDSLLGPVEDFDSAPLTTRSPL